VNFDNNERAYLAP